MDVPVLLHSHGDVISEKSILSRFHPVDNYFTFPVNLLDSDAGFGFVYMLYVCFTRVSEKSDFAS